MNNYTTLKINILNDSLSCSQLIFNIIYRRIYVTKLVKIRESDVTETIIKLCFVNKGLSTTNVEVYMQTSLCHTRIFCLEIVR